MTKPQQWLSSRALCTLLLPLIALNGCSDIEEGTAVDVRYEIVITQGIDSEEIPPFHTCSVPRFHWIMAKRLDAQGNPINIHAVPATSGRLDDSTANPQCIYRTQRRPFIGEFRIVATDYEWIATCEEPLLALETSGSFHNIRFVKGEDSCIATIQQEP